MGETLEWVCPFIFGTAVLAVFVAGILCRVEILRLFGRLKGRPAKWLTLICAIALLVRLLAIPATHRIYYDEHTYLQIARGIAEEGRGQVATWGQISNNHYRCVFGVYPHWAVGWPTLLAGVMKLTKYAPWILWWVNLILSLFSVVLVALLGSELSGRAGVGIAAAAVFAFIPVNQLWSRTTASEVFAVMASVFAVLAAVRFARDDRPRQAILSAVALVVASMARNESIVLCLVCATLLVRADRPKSRSLVVWTLAVSLGLIPQALHLGLVSLAYDPRLTEGSCFTLLYFVPNVRSVIEYLRFEPSICLAMALFPFGLFLSPLRRDSIVVGLWGLLMFFLPMFYFAGAYYYPGGDRFILACMPALALGAGSILWRVHNMLSNIIPPILLGVVWLTVSGVTFLRVPSYVAVQDEKTHIPRADCAFLRMALRCVPEGALVLTTDPPVVLAEGRSAFFLPWSQGHMDYLDELAKPDGPGLYLYTSPSSSPAYWPDGEKALAAVWQSFKMTLIVEESDIEGRREFYRVGPRKTSFKSLYQSDPNSMPRGITSMFGWTQHSSINSKKHLSE
jgi:hypothetical protein